MHLIDVSPILPALREPFYSYRIDQAVTRGALVRIPWRKKFVYGIVIESTPLQQAKSRIKQIGVSLKTAEPIPGVCFKAQYIDALETYAIRNVSSVGSLLSSFYPWSSNQEASTAFEEKLEKLFSTSNSEHATRWIKTLSVYPTAQSAENAYENLIKSDSKKDTSDGQTVVVFSGSKTKKYIANAFEKISELECTHIIATAPFAPFFIPFVEKVQINESWRSPKHQKEPYISYASLLDCIAEATKTNTQTNTVTSQFPITIFQKQHDTEITDTLITMLKERFEKNKKSIVFAERKSLYAYVACNDCGTVMQCPECNKPFSLLSTQGRHFACTSCNTSSPARDVCAVCGGTRLALRRPGIESMIESIQKAMPNASLLSITKESTPTRKQFQNFIEKMSTTDIVITTSAGFDALSGLFKKLEHSDKKYAVFMPYAYSLITMPDYRISEKIRNTTQLLSTYAPVAFFCTETHKTLCEETILSEQKTFERNEKRVRELAHFPPFGHIIKISFRGNARTGSVLEPYFQAIENQTKKDSLISKRMPILKKGMRIMGGLTITTGVEIPPATQSFLRDAPPAVRVDIDPDRFSW